MLFQTTNWSLRVEGQTLSSALIWRPAPQRLPTWDWARARRANVQPPDCAELIFPGGFLRFRRWCARSPQTPRPDNLKWQLKESHEWRRALRKGGEEKKATRDLLMFVNITGRFPASTLLQYSKMQRALVSISCNENKRARRRRKDVIVTRLNL